MFATTLNICPVGEDGVNVESDNPYILLRYRYVCFNKSMAFIFEVSKNPIKNLFYYLYGITRKRLVFLERLAHPAHLEHPAYSVLY